MLSWFPYSGDSPLNGVRHVVFTMTEPVLAPFRKLIPPVGMFDMSFIVAIIVVEIIVQVFASWSEGSAAPVRMAVGGPQLRMAGHGGIPEDAE